MKIKCLLLLFIIVAYASSRELPPNVKKVVISEELESQYAQLETQVDGFFSSGGHTNNWAVLMCASRFWLNYRHIANVLSVYRTVKRLGIPDSQIILMLPDDVACNPRNRFRATVYNNARREVDLYGSNIEVDYRGYEVTVENVIRLLTGRLDPNSPPSKFLATDDRSNILIYMTGHGGDDFIKLQDSEEISGEDLADAFQQMHAKGRYHEILYMVDTCQASTMYEPFYSPNILAVGSSLRDQNSYSHHPDPEIGVAVIDRFTYYNLEMLENIDKASSDTLQQLFALYNSALIASDPGIRSDLFRRRLDRTKLTDFFGAVQNVFLSKSVGTTVLKPLPTIQQLAVDRLESAASSQEDERDWFQRESSSWKWDQINKVKSNPLIFIIPMTLYVFSLIKI